MKFIKNYIHRKCIKRFLSYPNTGKYIQVDVVQKRICFDWLHLSVFQHFANPVQVNALFILMKYYDYKVYESKLKFLNGLI